MHRRNQPKGFAQDRSGATSIEYSLIAAFVGLAIITASIAIGAELVGVFQDVEGGFKNASP